MDNNPDLLELLNDQEKLTDALQSVQSERKVSFSILMH